MNILTFKIILICFVLMNFHLKYISNQSIYRDSEISKSQKNELNCQEYPKYRNLEISTNYNENSEDFNIVIMKECQITENWTVKDDYQRQCIIPERVYEGEDNIRRSFRFTYNKNNNYKDQIKIKSISVDYPKNIAETTLTKNNIILNPGESMDIYVDYDCLDMDQKKRVDGNWFKLRFNINFEDDVTKSFEYIKICTATYSDKLDLSHIVIIAIVFLIVYATVKEYLKSKVEGIIVEKFTEIKNPENLIIISIVIALILIFLGVVNLLPHWINIASFLVGSLSIAMLTESILRKNSVLTHLENKTYEIPYLGSITMFFLVCLAFGIFVNFIWIESENWFINNLISISVSIISIRIFKFTSFKFIVGLYIIAFVYEYIWIHFKSNYYGENYKLTDKAPINLPLNILCPEMLSSPFSACNSLPIADIILPGIFLMYSKKFDESKYIQNYFLVGVGAFGVGLIINLFVYYGNMLPTPSFFFTGPLILIATLSIAYKRQELYEYVEGFTSTIYENKADNNLSDNNLADYFEQQRQKGNSSYRPPTMMELNEVDNEYEKETKK